MLCTQELRAIPGVGAVVDALSAYTERHLARMDRLRRSVRLLDYTLGCMHVLEETSAQACPALKPLWRLFYTPRVAQARA